MMRHTHFLRLILLTSAFASAVSCGFSQITFAFHKDTTENEQVEKIVYESPNLHIRKISKHVYQHTSYLPTESWGNVPCNGMIYINHGEALIADTPVDDTSSLELIRFIQDKLNATITGVVATHFHEDCVGGLQTFHAAHINSYAYSRTIELADSTLPLPQTVLEANSELTVGREKVQIDFFGEGHTRDNVVVYVPEDEVLFGGCLIKELGAGKGNLADANTDDWSRTVEGILATYPNLKKVIPGHGEPGGSELLTYTIRLFR